MNDLIGSAVYRTRILFVLSSLGVGGLETWLLNIVKTFQKLHGFKIQCDFLTLLDKGGYYKQMLADMECNIFHIQLNYKHIFKTFRQLFLFIRQGQYDIVHCQSDYLSGIVMTAAFFAHVPVRAYHIHSTKFAFGPDSSFIKKNAGKLLKFLANMFSHHAIACSKEAGDSFFSGNWPSCAKVLYCGIDTDRFRFDSGICRAKILSELNLSNNAKIILSIGRLTTVKNISLIIKAMVLLNSHKDIIFLHAGDGSEKDFLDQEIKRAGLSENCKLLGLRNDIPELLLASDLFVMPSFFEGLPLVLLEAQAAGLPIVASDVITREVMVIPELFMWLSPHEPTARWAEAVEHMLNRKLTISKQEALQAVIESNFNITNSAHKLLEIYGCSDIPIKNT